MARFITAAAVGVAVQWQEKRPRVETETRWIVLGTDGRHVSLGRAEPSEAEIVTASDALAAQGLSGWLARMHGEYYSRGKISVEPLRRIGIALEADWQAALTAFHAARQHKLTMN